MSVVDLDPSPLWVVIPSIVLVTSYLARKWYLARRLHVHGIGRGAPGFQTSVKKVRVTPEIAARIRRGEEVSPDEIEAAARKADLVNGVEGGSSAGQRRVIEERDDRHLINDDSKAKEEEVVNEWLPESITKPNKRKRGHR